MITDYSGYTQYNIDPTGRTRFPGIYRAKVLDNVDHSSQNRLEIAVPQIAGSSKLGWADACLPAGVTITLPEIGSEVWVMFEAGDPGYPVWIGTKS